MMKRLALSSFGRRAFIATALALVSLEPARAQSTVLSPPETADSGFEVLLTPYLWLPWTNFSARPNNDLFPSKSIDISPWKLLDHIKLVPFMGEAELRYGQFGLIADYLHAPVSSGVSTHDILFTGGSTALTMNIGTGMIMYRLFAWPDQYLDVGAGVRAWGITGNITLHQGLLPSFSVADGLSWADPLIGGRYHYDFGNGLGATVYADGGGFGVGAHADWQVVGSIDYAYDSQVDLHGGLRSLNFDYGAPRAELHQHMLGPFAALTYRLP